ncbi:Palmitoyl-protein thioesterase 1, partial [Globisporangium splendens]
MVNVMTAVYAGGGGGNVVGAGYAVSLSAEEQLPKKRVRVYEPIEMQTPDPLPVVIMHGMGDAAGNRGMVHIRDLVAKQLNTYAVNIQIGNSVQEDVKNSFFITMDEQVEMFAKQVQADSRLAKGFNAVGFSQSNYFRDPMKISDYLTHGAVLCVFHCAVVSLVQHVLLYPCHSPTDAIFPAKFLPDLNNEKPKTNATYRENFIKLQNLVLVRAEKDTQVFPKDSEWFGAYADGDPYKTILAFNETAWYQQDSFGLQTLHRAGKVHFLSTPGNHLQFTTAFFMDVVAKFFTQTLAVV